MLGRGPRVPFARTLVRISPYFPVLLSVPLAWQGWRLAARGGRLGPGALGFILMTPCNLPAINRLYALHTDWSACAMHCQTPTLRPLAAYPKDLSLTRTRAAQTRRRILHSTPCKPYTIYTCVINDLAAQGA